ncbi:MAG TPA: thioesterase family protein [Labilithrix sp.]|jgi:4-hydroxybenzoyl-CoA thioesterase|nr:thioesterase family protein [Labilithrix sp.]
MAVIYERAVRFEEIDAAGIMFFARYFHWCHEAMERFFDELPGGYVELIMKKRLGFPAVHMTGDWKTPLRYGDAVRIETSVVTIGTTSTTFRYVFTKIPDGAYVAKFEHVTVFSNLDAMTKRPIPTDVRALLEAHRTSG